MAKIVVNGELCKGCTLCILACPKKTIEMGKAFNMKGYNYVTQVDEAGCTGCKMCAVMCPEAALEVYK
jgi:2-oxoglutarate ferredoxin oxidoreductase subunit delta